MKRQLTRFNADIVVHRRRSDDIVESDVIIWILENNNMMYHCTHWDQDRMLDLRVVYDCENKILQWRHDGSEYWSNWNGLGTYDNAERDERLILEAIDNFHKEIERVIFE